MVAELLTKTLYEQDYLLWLETTANQIQQKSSDKIDWENLEEEIIGLIIHLKHSAKSYLEQLLIHLLLLAYWESEREYCESGWQDEIDNFRDRLQDLLASKSLKNYVLNEFPKIYQRARKKVINKTKLPAYIFPESCPFSIPQILDEDFYGI